jgi:phosphohistidine swiveling domain-containing protein
MYHCAVAATLLWLRELASAGMTPEEVGGKARHLALLCAAGLPVPDGFVLPAAAIPAGGGSAAAMSQLVAEAQAAAAGLGLLLAVRSSSPAEDRAEGAAPGLFSSQLDIRPDDLGPAIRDVLASAEGPAVRAYLAQRVSAGSVALSVIVQRQVGGRAHGVLYTRPPGQPERDEVWVEAAAADGLAATAISRRSGEAVSRDKDFPLDGDRLAELVRLGLAAEQAIAPGPAGADVEWVLDDGGDLWLVQARPIRHTPPRAQGPALDLAFSRGDPDTVWRWDAAHNPDPLSPAQAGLVDWVAALSPAPLRVVDGYLYVGSRTGAAPSDAAPASDTGALQALFAEVERDIERALAPLESAEPPELTGALAAYRIVYEAYMVRLTPALASARAALRAQGVAMPPPESAVGRAMRTGDRQTLAALAPVWDVAAPTFGEGGGEVDRAAGRVGQAREPLELPAPAGDLAATVRAISEADDILFFRAQRAVRRALLGLARAWRLDPPDDIFYLPLDQVCAHAERGTSPDAARAHELASESRQLRQARRERAAPLAFRDGRPIAAPASGGLDFWRGRSAGGGSIRGRVLKVDDLGRLADDPDGRVIVAQGITPAALVQLTGAAALVCEQGGVLDHAAALARELALPCVVGCRGAWHTLATGDEVLVDGDAGLVVRLVGGG